ncbi:MAG: O-antigen ligase family protein, partial [Planctomycetota bacterium]
EGSRGHPDVRAAAWPPTLRLAAGRPVLGAGLGTYRRAIHLTQPEDIPRELYFAHSDPLNVLAEAGAFGLLVVVTIGIMGFMVAVRLARDGEHPGAGPGAACVAGLTAFVAMACVDFPLQIPATSLMFTVLLFVPVALRADLHPAARDVGPRRNLARLAAAAGFALLLLGVIEDVRRGIDEPGALTRGEAHYERGRELVAARSVAEARDDLETARRLQPFDARTRLYMSQVHYYAGEYEAGRREIRAAWRLARGQAAVLFSIGLRSVSDSTLSDLTVPAFREASILEARFFPEVLKTDGLTPAELLEIVPEHPHLLGGLSRHLEKRGAVEEAAEAARRAAAAK